MRAIMLAAALVMVGSPALAETRPIVVELFTSQGCSSCPPADALLGELAADPHLIALAFHVDYWDRLGWKDPLSAPGSTARQHDYARMFGNNEIYTPQLVVDGRRELVGSDRAQVKTAIAETRPEATASISFAADGKSVAIGAGAGNGKIIIVNFAVKRTNPIARGENAGRTATDIHAVTKLRAQGDWTGSAQSFSIEPPATNEGVAILIQGADGRFLGAASQLGSS